MVEYRRAGLLSDAQLWASDVVANCVMNRLRQLAGVNSYRRELGFDPLEFLLDRSTAAPDNQVRWLDLCCGSGRALHQAGQQVQQAGLGGRITITGVDLVDDFDPHPPGGPVELICTPVDQFRPVHAFDLITCVHGLHYVGDKLAVLARAAGWLTSTGRLVADFDPASIHLTWPTGRVGTPRQTVARLREAGFTYDPRRRQVSRTGHLSITFADAYLGADDRAGPNYTGQPAVTSHYGPPNSTNDHQPH